jgi:hypothetical protein
MRTGTTLTLDDAARRRLEAIVADRNMQRHRHQGFIRFLGALERDIPKGPLVHVILDDPAAHETAAVPRWLARHPRWTSHFTLTSSSKRASPDARRLRGWIDRLADDRGLDAVESVYTELGRRRLKHGVFRFVADLQAATDRFVDDHNQNPEPFVRRADPDVGIAAHARGFQALRSNQ